jgi:hypothetical protein
MSITNQTINGIFNTLDRYRNFCRDYGYRFDEADLFSHKSFSYKQFQRFSQGKEAKNQWEADIARFNDTDYQY